MPVEVVLDEREELGAPAWPVCVRADAVVGEAEGERVREGGDDGQVGGLGEMGGEGGTA